MTAKQATEAIKNLAQTDLPALLAAEGLGDFDSYTDHSPDAPDQNAFAVYAINEKDAESARILIILIQAQLYGADLIQDYHSVVMDFLRNNLRPETVDMENIDEIEADIWPIDIRSSNSFAYYTIILNRSLDDCD